MILQFKYKIGDYMKCRLAKYAGEKINIKY